MSNYNNYRNKKYKYYESSSYQPGQGQGLGQGGQGLSQHNQSLSNQSNYNYNRPYYQGQYNQGYYNNYYNYKPKYKRKRFDKGSHYSPGYNQGYGDDRREERRNDERYEDRRNSYDEYRPKPAFELNLKLRSESVERDWDREEFDEREWDKGEKEDVVVAPVFNVGEKEKYKKEEEEDKKEKEEDKKEEQDEHEEVKKVDKLDQQNGTHHETQSTTKEMKEDTTTEKAEIPRVAVPEQSVEAKAEEETAGEEKVEEKKVEEKKVEEKKVEEKKVEEKKVEEKKVEEKKVEEKKVEEKKVEEKKVEEETAEEKLEEMKGEEIKEKEMKQEEMKEQEKKKEEEKEEKKTPIPLEKPNLFDDQDDYEDAYSDSDAETVVSDSAPTTSNAIKLMKEINPDKKKPYVIKRDASGSSLLQRACKKGNFAEVKSLIERGASPNESDFCGFTCLHEAALNGDAEIVTYLIEHGADVNKQALPDGDLETPLIDAADNKHLDIVKILLKNGADPRIYNSDGFTALTKIHNQHQDEDGYDEIIKLLEEAHSRYVEKTEPVHTLRSPSPNTIIEDPNDTYFSELLKKKNHTALVYKYAAEGVKDLSVQYIVEGGRLDLKPDILILAARNGHLELVDIMLGLVGDYDIDLVNNCGLTALLASVGRGHFKVIEFLLDRGANPFLRRKPDDLNALEISQRSPNFDMQEIELIEKYMKKNPNHSILSKHVEKRRSEEPEREIKKKVKVEKKDRNLSRTVSNDDKPVDQDKKSHELFEVKSNDLTKVKSNELFKVKSNDLFKVKSNDLFKVKSNDEKTPDSRSESKQSTPRIRSPSPPPEPTKEELEMRAKKEEELKIYQEKAEAKRKARRDMFLKSEREKERRRIEEEQKLIEEKKQQEILKKQEDENKIKQIELETQRIQDEKYQKRLKLKWDHLPIGLRTMKTKNLQTLDILKYCPVYKFTINNKEYVTDLQITLVTGISMTQIASDVSKEDQINASATDKSKLWNLFSPLIGNEDSSKPIILEALVKGHEQFQSLVINFVSLDAIKQLLKEKAPLTHTTIVEGNLFTNVDFAAINSFQIPPEKQKPTPISLEFVPFIFRNRPDLIKAAHELKTNLW